MGSNHLFAKEVEAGISMTLNTNKLKGWISTCQNYMQWLIDNYHVVFQSKIGKRYIVNLNA